MNRPRHESSKPPADPSSLRRIMDAVARVHPGRPMRQARYLAMALYAGEPFVEWVRTCAAPGLAPWVRHYPRVILKPLRSCYGVGITRAHRYGILRATYGVLATRPDLAASVAGPGHVLATMDLPENQGRLELTLSILDRFRREGDLTVSIHFMDTSGQSTRIHSNTFSLERRADGLHLLIGCTQGVIGNADAVNGITKATDGIRPKALALYTAQWVGAAWGIVGVHAAGNTVQSRANNQQKWLNFGTSTVGFDYDAFWTEMGGVRADTGWFTLPTLPERRDRADIKANKRPAYARRYALYDRFAVSISGSLAPAARAATV